MEYEMGAVIHGEGAVTNLDYHRDGKWLVMSTNVGSLHMIDSLKGEECRKLYAKTCGTGLVKFTHHDACVIFTPERGENDVKYLCTVDNHYLRNFKGHSDRITSLSMSPLDDSFMTASADKTVRIWNLKSPAARSIAKLTLPPRCENILARYDESGLVYGVLCQDSFYKTHTMKLFDARNFDAGPFEEILPERSLLESAILRSSPDWSKEQIRKSLESIWHSFEFSSDGNHILINTQSDVLLVLDGFHPNVEPLAITLRKNDLGLALGGCISPDAKHVITASEDNELLIFDYKPAAHGGVDSSDSSDVATSTAAAVPLSGVLTGHVSPIGSINCNPRYNVMASGCVNTVLWIPKVIQ